MDEKRPPAVRQIVLDDPIPPPFFWEGYHAAMRAERRFPASASARQVNAQMIYPNDKEKP
jgi:hypothetical protein